MFQLPLSAGDLYDLVVGCNSHVDLERTICQRRPDYFEGAGGLRRTVLIELWTPYLAAMKKCAVTGIRECQAAIVAFESFLDLFLQSDHFGEGFKQICQTMPVTHSLKVALVGYMASLVPQRRLIGAVLGEERETIEPAKSLSIAWIGLESSPRPLRQAMTRASFTRQKELDDLRREKSNLLARLESEMGVRQSDMKREIANELKTQFDAKKEEAKGGDVCIKDLTEMASKVCETKLTEFNQQLIDHVNQIKMMADMDVEIFRTTKKKL